MGRPQRLLTAAALAISLTAQWSNARAEEGPDQSPWTLELTLYAWLPETFGTASARGETAHIAVDFDKLFDLLGDGEAIAAGGHLEARYDRLSFFLDAFGGTVRPTSNVTVGQAVQRSGTADVTENYTFFEFGPAYRVLEWPLHGPGRPIAIDLLTGGRLMYFFQSITLKGSGGRFGRYASSSSTWVDPFVGGRFSVPLVGDLDLLFRGDIGGFGAGSQLAWNLIGGFKYRLPWQPMGAETSVVAVYKALDFDYESGSGADAVDVAMDFRGPAVGFSIGF